MPTTSELSAEDRREHVAHPARVSSDGPQGGTRPLSDLATPDRSSPVFVTSNYKLSFDALRSNLKGTPSYLLVLDTKGINVWCAAGKGTFGTDEIEERVRATGLKEVVDHRRLVLPQLGAPGVCAHEVKRRTGFTVEYGPVRAEDLPAYMAAGKVTPEMRQVRFNLRDRAVLVPVEMKNYLLWAVLAAILASLLLGWAGLAAVVVLFLTGTVLFPLLLPVLPVKAFSAKGFILGAAVAVAFALILVWAEGESNGSVHRTSGSGLGVADITLGRLPRAQLHWVLHPHLQDRGAEGDIPIHTAHGGDVHHRGGPHNCSFVWMPWGGSDGRRDHC